MATHQFGVNTSDVSCPITVTGKLRSYEHAPLAPSIAEARDENGDVDEVKEYGSGDVEEHTAAWELMCPGDSVGTITLGAASGGKAVESVKIATSNSDNPTVTIKWYEGLPTTCASTDTYSPTVNVEAKRKAQNMGGVVTGPGTSGLLQSFTWTASCAITIKNGEDGDPAGYSVGDGKVDISGESIGGTWSKATSGTIVITGGNGESQQAEAFATTSIEATKYLDKDSSASD